MSKAKIIVLAGQSNAVGVGHTEYLPRHFSDEEIKKFRCGYDNVLMNYFSHDMWSKGFVKTSVGCCEKNKDTLGPEIGIARALAAKYPDERFYIVKSAVGGTNIFHDWLSPSCKGEYNEGSYAEGDADSPLYRGGGWCFNELVKVLNESISILEGEGSEPEICAFCWMQGESDAISVDTVEKYGARYENMLADFNEKFKGYTQNCIYIDAGISEIWQYYKEINAWKRMHAEESENSFYIDTIGEGLTTLKEPEPEADIAHYDSDCTVKLGELFASKIN